MKPTRWIIGNWKMNGGVEANARLISDMRDRLAPASSVCVAVCPPFPYLSQVQALLGLAPELAVALGAQDVSAEAQGAFTGQVSASMLRECGVSLVLVGHSERRQGLGESDALVGQKAAAALRAGLTPVVCVGETLNEREHGQAEAVVLRQLDAALDAIQKMKDGAATNVINAFLLAYEPVWAIGTGKTATPEDAQTIHAVLRRRLVAAGAARTPILYGGSVKADNAASLLGMPDVDGALVGGAALDAVAFSAICAAEKAAN